MSRWVRRSMLLILPVMVFMIVLIGNASADELRLIGSDGDTVAFPYYVKDISPKMAEKSVSEEQVDAFWAEEARSEQSGEQTKSFRKLQKDLQVSYPSSVLEQLELALEVLPEAARDVNGNAVKEDALNGKTIYVNSLVQEALDRVGLLPGDNPRNTAMLFQLLDAASEYKLTALGNAFAHKIASRIERVVFDQLSDLKGDRYWKHRSEEERFHQAVENALISVQDSLSEYQQEFPNIDCTSNQAWIEKYILLFLQGVNKEFTFADYMGLHGQKNWQSGHVVLPNIGLTSLDGLELITGPNRITEINVSHNDIVTMPMMKSNERLSFAFSRLTNLKSLNLSNNKLTSLPERVFAKNPLHALFVDHNQLTELPEKLCRGLGHLKEISYSNNRMSEEEMTKIEHWIPKEVVQTNEAKMKTAKKEKKGKRTRSTSKTSYR